MEDSIIAFTIGTNEGLYKVLATKEVKAPATNMSPRIQRG
eukprot:CAMPEP_0177551930 /NCGR_PEP_ID=MMETSP0369-20130122/66484_1 /TAXON_ID=447022 ORGANISM="Scrippsiella hangoei-like, Strain SHHI-4" /NCGR_SAMPLE_ID=MMETSP0369 /ASSEMBLY_ACC=CAM_ASM_000364 /LENGTH=39 /DNA_ID= /DNA_START= /DNA_END= /DNA_ORIENTATION=